MGMNSRDGREGSVFEPFQTHRWSVMDALVVSALLLMSVRFFFPVDDPDLYWHLVIGRWIRAHGALPAVEQWNAFGAGHPFRAYSWSAEVVLDAVNRLWGMRGLWWLQALGGLSVVLAAWVSWLKAGAPRPLAAACGALLVLFTDPFVAPRPQTFTFLLFAFIPGLAGSVLRHGITWRNAVGIFLLFCAWANCHLAMVLGLGYLGGLLFAFTAERAKLTAKALAIGFAGTLATPYGGGVWLTFISKIGHVDRFRSAIVEFEALSPGHFMFPLWISCVALFVTAVAVDRSLLKRENVFRAAVTASFLALGAYAVKFLAFSAIAALYFVAVDGCRSLRGLSQRWKGAKLASSVFQRVGGLLARPALALPFAALFVLAFGTGVAAKAVNEPAADDVVYSGKALDYVLAGGLPRPVLTDFSNGGYLMYRLMDDEGVVSSPVAIDGRTNILSESEADAYYRMERVEDGWEDFIHMYAPGTIVWPTARNGALVKKLRATPHWCERLRGDGDGNGYSVFVSCQGQTEGKAVAGLRE